MICQNCNHNNKILSFYCEECFSLLSNEKGFKFNSDFKDLIEKTEEEHIFKYNNIFLILYPTDYGIINFGEFFNYDDAIIKKNELSYNGWPIPSNLINQENIISNNIFEKDGKYFVFNIENGRKKIFGQFKTKKEATIAKYKLIENNWNKSSRDNLPEFIKKNKSGNFYIMRKIYGNNVRFGTFNSLEDAIFVKSLLKSKNWKVSNFDIDDCIYQNEDLFYIIKPSKNQKLKILGKFDSIDEAKVYSQIKSDTSKKSTPSKRKSRIKTSRYGKHISFASGKYYLTKSIKGKNRTFGRFINHDVAIFVRDKLIDNNWDVNYFRENNIFEVDGEFLAFRVSKGTIDFLGRFSSREDAKLKFIKHSELHNKNSTPSRHKSKIRTSSYGKYISFASGKYYLKKSLNGRNRSLGKFIDYDVVVFVRDKLVDNNWNVGYFRENNIFEVDGEFLAFRVSKGTIDFLGRFSSREDAELKVIKYAELYNKNSTSQVESKYGKYISFSGSKYYLTKSIKGKNRTFGRFIDHDVAVFVRDKLVDNNWNVGYFRENNIFEVDGEFLAFRVSKGTIDFLGRFSSREDVELKFIKRSEVHNKNSTSQIESKYGKNISFASGKYYVRKSIKGKERVFGRFINHDVAVFVRDRLVDNNWNINYFRRNPTGIIGNESVSFKVSNKEIMLDDDLSGIVQPLESKSKVNKISNIKTSPYGTNIYLIGGLFNVRKQINNEQIVFGRFKNHNVAVFVRDRLVENNWNINYFRRNPTGIIDNERVSFKITNKEIRLVGDDFSSKVQSNKSKSKVSKSSKVKKSKYGSYIYSIKNGFRVEKSINNKKVIFGKFMDYDVAVFVRDRLIENNWEIGYFKQYPILKIDDKFGLFEVEKNEIELIGKFNSYNDAESAINNEENMFIKSEFTVSNNEKVFAKFSSIEPARIIRDNLVDNNWDLNYFKNNNIFEYNNDFYAFKVVDEKIELVDIFNNYGDAKLYLDNKKDEGNLLKDNLFNNDDFIKNNVYDDLLIIPEAYKRFMGSYDEYNDEILNVFSEILEKNDEDIILFKNNNIFKFNDKFFIFKLDGNKVRFIGVTDSNEDAKDKLNWFNGVVSDGNRKDSIKIIFKDDKYHLIHKNNVLGIFSLKQNANFVKNVLIKNNKDINYFKNNNIFKVGNRYFIFILVGEEIKFLGEFTSKKRAKNRLKNFNKFSDDNKNEIYIKSNGSNFIVRNSEETFAKFSLKTTATTFKNILNQYGNDLNFFKNNNIFHSNGSFYVFMLVNNEIKFLGYFDNKSAAKNSIKVFKDNLNSELDNDEDSSSSSDIDSSRGLKSNDNKDNLNSNVLESPVESTDSIQNSNMNDVKLRISKFKGKFVVSHKNEIWGRFPSNSIAETFIDIVKSFNANKKFFVNHNIFSSNSMFYIFKLVNNEIKYFDNFELYDGAKDWIINYNNGVSLDKDKLNTLLIEKPTKNTNSKVNDGNSHNNKISSIDDNDGEKSSSTIEKEQMGNKSPKKSDSYNITDKSPDDDLEPYSLTFDGKIVGGFSSYYNLNLFNLLFKRVGYDIEKFNKYHIFNIAYDFYIFKLIDGEVKLLNNFELYSRAFKWAQEYNLSNPNEKINLDAVNSGINLSELNYIRDLPDGGEGIYLVNTDNLESTSEEYIFKINDKFSIVKNKKLFGEYFSFYEAKVVKNFLILHDWDLNKINESSNVFQYNQKFYSLAKSQYKIIILDDFDSLDIFNKINDN